VHHDESWHGWTHSSQSARRACTQKLRHRWQKSFPALWSWQLPSPGLRVVIVVMAPVNVPTHCHSASATTWSRSCAPTRGRSKHSTPAAHAVDTHVHARSAISGCCMQHASLSVTAPLLGGYQTVVQEQAAAPFRSPKSPYYLFYVASTPCTPHNLVTPRTPALMNQDWFLVLHLANLDAQE
jgi:hypothetical protein